MAQYLLDQGAVNFIQLRNHTLKDTGAIYTVLDALKSRKPPQDVLIWYPAIKAG